jgi:predicted permease
VSLSGHRLIGDGSSRSSFSIAGQKTRPDEERAAHWNGVGPRFFETMGIPILLGRGLTNRDNEAAPKVVVVDEAFARRYFANESPVGKRLSWHDQDVEIVGVARDAKYSDVRRATDATIYQPYLQVLQLLQGMNFEVRTAGDATSLIPGVRRAVAAVDANLPLMDIRTQAQQIEGSLLQERLFARLTSGFGFLALLLASIGLYGVMAYMVARRTGEIGIRMAMGAGQGDVMQMVLRETVLVTGIGMLVGLAGAMASTRLIRNQLFGLTPTDPVSMAVAVAVLAAVAAAAGYIPARRASRIDPMTALRNE